ncbi:hypothetical protein [Acinetobacter indicus]|uniref:hypothetical protein n=1 Tax=Acinetobacter indicus TaxID=756892 RepID=UPI000948C364|nr:hypothetical protein [Acinetobacter indicus]
MILLIDDKSDIPSNLKTALIEELPQFKDQIEIWNPDNIEELKQLYDDNKGSPDKDSAADEDVWRRVLEQREINMVVVDHDLSELNVRISESAITNACKQLAIPVCNYHRKPPNNDSQNLKDRVNQARSFSIEIEIDEDNQYRQCAKEIINVFQGFQSLKEKISGLGIAVLSEGPAKIISEVLGKPELESIFARYTASSTLAADIIQYDDENTPENEIPSILKERIHFILGCWLHNYVLPFPGILLNSIAAASYINLDPQQFNEYSAEFEDARYNGPFSTYTSYWWRYDLDQILFDANAEDAVQFLENKQMPNILPCKCSVNSESNAGYYCIVKKQPISYEQSVGHLSWIPEGADLCRIHKKIYRRLAPMMGL